MLPWQKTGGGWGWGEKQRPFPNSTSPHIFAPRSPSIGLYSQWVSLHLPVQRQGGAVSALEHARVGALMGWAGLRLVDGSIALVAFMQHITDYAETPLEDYGPAMRSLTDMQRRFVRVWVEHPSITLEQAAKLSGYGRGGTRSGGGAGPITSNVNTLRNISFNLLQNDRIATAIQEEVARSFRSRGAIVGFQVMLQIATTDGHKDQARMAEALANRSGFHGVQEHIVTRNESDGDVVERIRRLATMLGVDPGRLLGGNAEAAPPMKVIEHETTKAGANEAGDNSDR